MRQRIMPLHRHLDRPGGEGRLAMGAFRLPAFEGAFSWTPAAPRKARKAFVSQPLPLAMRKGHVRVGEYLVREKSL